VRRLIWNIITQERTGRTIILTTHSMEEAEVLCQRIGIMAKGNLRCLGVRRPKRAERVDTLSKALMHICTGLACALALPTSRKSG